MLSFFVIVNIFSDQSLTISLCVINITIGKYSFTLLKNCDTFSRFSFDTFPKISSNTMMFGLGKQLILVKTHLNAKDDKVFSNPLPADKG